MTELEADGWVTVYRSRPIEQRKLAFPVVEKDPEFPNCWGVGFGPRFIHVHTERCK